MNFEELKQEAVRSRVLAIAPQTDYLELGTSLGEPLKLSWKTLDNEDIRASVSDLFASSNIIKVFADGASDRAFLLRQGLAVDGTIFDVKLADSLLTAGLELPNEYPAITERHLGTAKTAPDAKTLLKLRENLRVQLKEEGLVQVAQIEFQATLATAQMTLNGARLDTAWLVQRQQELQIEKEAAGAKVKEWLKERLPEETEAINAVDLASTKKAHKSETIRLFNKAGVPLTSFDKNRVNALATESPILNEFQTYRIADARIGNAGIQGLLAKADEKGMVYPTWNQNIAATGRMSASEPAIQNVSADLKKAIIPVQTGTERMVFIRADYSQQELRILAEISGDKKLIEAYQKGQDAHRLTASTILGKPEFEITDEERKLGKPVNFGKIYGQSPHGLQSYAKSSYGVEFTLEESQQFLKSFDVGYPQLAARERQVKAEFNQQWVEGLQANRRGDNDGIPIWRRSHNPQTRTLSGRKRQWHPKEGENPPVPEALNAPIQGSGADISKLALSVLPKALEGTGAAIALIKHDEIVLTAPESRAEEIGEILQTVMVAAGKHFTPRVPIVAEIEIADNLAGERLTPEQFREREARLVSREQQFAPPPAIATAKQLAIDLSASSSNLSGSNPATEKHQSLSWQMVDSNNSIDFDIRNYIHFTGGRASCPCCVQEGKTGNANLSLDEKTGRFWCWRGSGGTPPGFDVTQTHDERAIRKVLGLSETGKVPLDTISETAKTHNTSSQNRESLKIIKAKTDRNLYNSQYYLFSPNLRDLPHQRQAREYLEKRGITEDMAKFYNIGFQMGFATADGREYPPAIAIYFRDAADPNKLYAKRRYAPWMDETEMPPGTPKWGQSGVPPAIWITHNPPEAESTWLCEGPWDAIRLSEAVRKADIKVAVACCTTGAGGVPPAIQLKCLPGEAVAIFYDADNAGVAGALKMQQALQEIGKQTAIARVPVPPAGITVEGYDVSDALDAGLEISDFVKAARDILPPPAETPAKAAARQQYWEWTLLTPQLERVRDYAELYAAHKHDSHLDRAIAQTAFATQPPPQIREVVTALAQGPFCQYQFHCEGADVKALTEYCFHVAREAFQTYQLTSQQRGSLDWQR